MGDREKPLPALRAGVLGPAEFDALINDLLGVAEVLEVREQAAPGVRATACGVDLRPAAARLVAGSIRAMQVRYRWAGEEWLDTLLSGRDDLRLVRARLSDIGPPEPLDPSEGTPRTPSASHPG